MPLEIYFIPGPWPGRLAIVARPRGGDWLADDIRGWKEAGVDVGLSLIEPQEAAEFDLTTEQAQTESQGILFHAYPIADRGVPRSRESFAALLRDLWAQLHAGHTVAVHCRQGNRPLVAGRRRPAHRGRRESIGSVSAR